MTPARRSSASTASAASRSSTGPTQSRRGWELMIMTGLLVSVRSADEARAAVAGGATIVDVKEPDRGPLGCAGAATWRAVRRVVPATVPVSVALGELGDWEEQAIPSTADWAGLAYRKVGLA